MAHMKVRMRIGDPTPVAERQICTKDFGEDVVPGQELDLEGQTWIVTDLSDGIVYVNPVVRR